MGEVASPKSLDGGEKINSILNFCDSAEGIYDAFINPKYKVGDITVTFGSSNKTMWQVGTEWVCKTQNTNSCEVSTGSIIKNVYGRLFRYIVDMCNSTLIVSPPPPPTNICYIDLCPSLTRTFSVFTFFVGRTQL